MAGRQSLRPDNCLMDPVVRGQRDDQRDSNQIICANGPTAIDGATDEIPLMSPCQPASWTRSTMTAVAAPPAIAERRLVEQLRECAQRIW